MRVEINPVRRIWDTYFQFSCDTLQGSGSILHVRGNKSSAANLGHSFPIFEQQGSAKLVGRRLLHSTPRLNSKILNFINNHFGHLTSWTFFLFIGNLFNGIPYFYLQSLLESLYKITNPDDFLCGHVLYYFLSSSLQNLRKILIWFPFFKGYGHIFPGTQLGRVVCILYSLIGVPINGILVGTLGVYFRNKVSLIIFFHDF